jgi:DNA-binding XRE family transcriptional regulator
MEQDEKVSAAALSLNPVTATGRAQRAPARTDARMDAPEVGMRDAPVGGEAAFSEAATLMAAPGAASGPAPEPKASEVEETEAKVSEAKSSRGKTPKKNNNVRRIRIERMVSKAELARRANLSVLTIDRVERGYGCRMDTKRKILEALGLSLADRVRVFGEEE